MLFYRGHFPLCLVLFLAPQTAVRVQLRLDKNLRLCGDNETDTDCCQKPLCVLETLQLSACVGSTAQASLLVQAKIYALLVPANAGSGKLKENVILSIWTFFKIMLSLKYSSDWFQIIKQSFQIKCTNPWALVPVTSHSENVTFAAAVTRYLHVSYRLICLLEY